jgi:hypothetical protein
MGRFSANGLQGSVCNLRSGASLRYSFTAQDFTLNIAFGGLDTSRPDNNPILNVFTLENVTLVIEPSTLANLALCIIGLGACRIKK